MPDRVATLLGFVGNLSWLRVFKVHRPEIRLTIPPVHVNNAVFFRGYAEEPWYGRCLKTRNRSDLTGADIERKQVALKLVEYHSILRPIHERGISRIINVQRLEQCKVAFPGSQRRPDACLAPSV